MKTLLIGASRNLNRVISGWVLVAGVVIALPAQAVPSFARQTGMDCSACHTSFPELTPFGRNFKLSGYTLGERQLFPVAVMAQFSVTHIEKQSSQNVGSGDVDKFMVRQNDPQFDGGSLFLAGKITDYSGAFIQWTYENLDHFRGDGSVGHHSHIDNTDVRIAGTQELFGKDVILGLDLNNSPTVQDVWNSTPAWGYPFNGSKLVSLGGPNASPSPSTGVQIDQGLAQAVTGLGGYFYWDRHLYGELSLYGTADGFFRPLSAGAWNKGSGPRLDGRDNPYWRLAWNQDWGAHSLMLGTYGMKVDMYSDHTNTSGPTDQYTDTAVDAQYQYLSDPHIITLQANYIHEKIKWNGSFANPVDNTPANPSDRLNTFKAKASYLYDRKFGGTLAYFQTTGSADTGLYSSNTTSKPNTRGYVVEFDYNPWTNLRLALQYTGYNKFNGSKDNYDVNYPGRSASDNNTLFLNTWFAF